MFDLHIEEIVQKKGKEYDRPDDVKLSLSGVEASISTQSGKRIIEELVDNAFKFSSAGQVVKIATEADDDFWVLTVKDSGLGMEQKEITHIGAYNQFQRKSREQQGSGLGLAIVQKMSQLYGGTLTIESEIGKGTLVTVRLPRPTTF
jgi:signal transduction histidine kinase